MNWKKVKECFKLSIIRDLSRFNLNLIEDSNNDIWGWTLKLSNKTTTLEIEWDSRDFGFNIFLGSIFSKEQVELDEVVMLRCSDKVISNDKHQKLYMNDLCQISIELLNNYCADILNEDFSVFFDIKKLREK